MRLFTVDEANALLPQVETMLRNLQRQRERLVTLEREYADALQRTNANGHSVAEKLTGLRQELEQAGERLKISIAALEDLGCTLKDLDMGLVDFPGLREGEVVNLCWRLGEPEIRFWHTLDTGFAHRQPL